VSELFAGHPNIIQGFNPFLPPGYHIECGAGNDPQTIIRVTTPMGTTVQSIIGGGRPPMAGAVVGQSSTNDGGVSQPTNAVATLGHRPGNAQTPTPGGQASVNGARAQTGPEKRDLVEFNFAIRYVNKIKVHLCYRPRLINIC
jgi:paired amphipathic helix protein Sin3a